MKGQRRERERRSNHVQRCQRFPSSRQEETHFQQKWERATQHFKCFGAAVISSIWFRKKLKRTPDEQVEIRVFFFVAPERELFFESAPVKCPAAIHGPAKAKKKKKKKKRLLPFHEPPFSTCMFLPEQRRRRRLYPFRQGGRISRT